MKFVKGQSGNTAGRPKGSFNFSGLLARQMLAAHAEEIIAATIKAAKKGDVGAMRLCWDRFALQTCRCCIQTSSAAQQNFAHG